MPEHILFRGAFIRSFDVRQSAGGESVFVTVHFSADFSDVVIAAMGWNDLPDGYKDADLKGELLGVEMHLKPNGAELKQYETKMPIKSVDTFKVVSLKQSEDKPDERELRFKVTSNAKKAATWLASYLQAIGKGKGQLKISYSEQAAMDGASEDERQATLAAAE